jgi:membrane-associated phospholipid phosphatase
MFLTAPLVWLQTWSSPGLTRTMEVISWFGYTRTAIAVAVLITFAFHLRAGVAVLLLLGLNSLAIDITKTAAGLPRPFAVDPSVRVLGWPAPAPIHWGTPAAGLWSLPGVTPPPTRAITGERANEADSETGFGFPSGHVSTTVTFVAGFAGLLGARWVRATGVAWLSLMAVSRLYLGRHFIGDVVGGLVLGILIVTLGMTVLRLWPLCRSAAPPEVARAARLNALLAAGLVATALIAGWPEMGDVGRHAGIALAVVLLTQFGMWHLPPRPLARAGLVGAAAVSYGLVWFALTGGLQSAQEQISRGNRLARSALPAVAMLVVPAAIAHRTRSTSADRRRA